MEDTLRVFGHPFVFKKDIVLILVLMEDTLRDVKQMYTSKWMARRLNPCFNGRYS